MNFNLEQYLNGKDKFEETKGKKVAIIGGGPAGIMGGVVLASAGYGVKIFEKEDRLSGAVGWGIPDFRYDKDEMNADIDKAIAAGIDVEYDCFIEEGDFKAICEDFDAVLIATGVSYVGLPEIPGVELEGVYEAVEVMRMFNNLKGDSVDTSGIGSNVVVTGGRGLAQDLSRTLIREDKKVTCVAAEGPDTILINEKARTQMEEEGIEIIMEAKPSQVLGKEGRVCGVEFETAAGESLTLVADTVVFASDRYTDIEEVTDAATNDKGRLLVNNGHNVEGKVFAAGDITGECDSITGAIKAGEAAAKEILEYLE